MVLYERSPDGEENALLSSGTKKGKFLHLKMNGNLVLKNARGRQIWDLKTAGQGGEKLVLRNSCNLALINAENSIIWSTSVEQAQRRSLRRSRGSFIYRPGHCRFCDLIEQDLYGCGKFCPSDNSDN